MQDDQVCFARSREQFPAKLYAILELANMQAAGSSGCSWLPHGRAFKIFDEHKFMNSCVPIFFKQTKIRSFHRQLNLWGFKRVSKSVDAGAWYNEFFIRGYPEEMKKMVRIKIKGKLNAKQDSPNKEEDPDFYNLPPLPSPYASNPLGNRGAGPRRVSVELGSTDHVSSREFRLNRSEFTSPEEPDLWMPETTSLPILGLARERQCPMTTSFQSSRYHYQAACYVAVSDNDELESRLTAGLEPLPFKDESMFPTKNVVKNKITSKIEPLPVDADIPFDEFARYIDNVIEVL